MFYLAKMEDIPSSPAPNSSSGIRGLFEQLRCLPPPRVVRFTNFGRALLTTLISGWVSLIVVFLRSGFQMFKLNSFDVSLLAGNISFVLVGGIVLWVVLSDEAKNRKLLSQGSPTLATVIEQRRRKRRGATFSEIIYEFRDASGLVHQGNGQDHSKSYIPGMQVPVFYDFAQPRRCVAICGTYLRLLGNEGRLLPQS